MGSIADHKNTALVGSGSVADRELAFWAGSVGGYVPKTASDRREQIDSAIEIYSDFANLEGWIKNANATVVGSRFASTVDGTAGDAIIPIYGPLRSARWSFIVKAAKTGTALNKSLVGFTVGIAPGTLPTGGYPTGAVSLVGYLQGSGIVFAPENLSANAVIVADASLTDATDYIVECGFDNDLANNPTYGYGNAFCVTVRTLGGVLVGSSQFGHAVGWGVMSNLMLRSNSLAGGIRNLSYKAHALGRIVRNGPAVSTPLWYQDPGPDPIVLRVPATPLRPYRVILFCHGLGQSVYFSNTGGSVENPLMEALERAGFITVIHNTHGNTWGNNTAHADLLSVYNAIIARWGIDTQIFLVGESMGAALAASVVAKGVIPVKAVVCIDGVFDIATMTAANAASITAAYPGGSSTYNNPIGYAAKNYGTVPFWISSSAADAVVPKTTNSDVFKTLLGAQVTQVVTTLGHTDASHFSAPAAMVEFLMATFA